MKNILILGGFGFLGTNTMKYAEKYDKTFRFIVLDRYEQHPAGVCFDNVVKTYAGDFTDSVLLERIFAENQIDYVFHMLSTTIPVGSNNAQYDVESNLIPTLNILNLMVKYKVNEIVYLSSGGAIYGIRERGKHREIDEVFPISSYGIVKLTIEKYLMQYAQTYEISPLILRLSNPYGPYHYNMKQGVINVAMTRALKNEVLEVWGNGKGKKDYIFVEDFVRILYKLIEKGIKNEVINVASGQTLSVNEIVVEIKHLLPNLNVEYKDAQRFDANHFELDTTKLLKLIPNFSFTSFQEGLQKTYYWSKTIC